MHVLWLFKTKQKNTNISFRVAIINILLRHTSCHLQPIYRIFQYILLTLFSLNCTQQLYLQITNKNVSDEINVDNRLTEAIKVSMTQNQTRQRVFPAARHFSISASFSMFQQRLRLYPPSCRSPLSRRTVSELKVEVGGDYVLQYYLCGDFVD